MPHICPDELRLLVAAVIFATPWLGWLRSWWHHRRRHAGCVGDGAGLGKGTGKLDMLGRALETPPPMCSCIICVASMAARRRQDDDDKKHTTLLRL